MITLKNVKVAANLSRETNAFTASVYFAGKRVGSAYNSGCGGITLVKLLDPNDSRAVEEFVKADPVARILAAESLTTPVEAVIDTLVDDHVELQWLKKKCRKHTLVVLKSHREGDMAQFSRPYTARFAERLREQHGDNLVEIINERFVK